MLILRVCNGELALHDSDGGGGHLATAVRVLPVHCGEGVKACNAEQSVLGAGRHAWLSTKPLEPGQKVLVPSCLLGHRSRAWEGGRSLTNRHEGWQTASEGSSRSQAPVTAAGKLEHTVGITVCLRQHPFSGAEAVGDKRMKTWGPGDRLMGGGGAGGANLKSTGRVSGTEGAETR